MSVERWAKNKARQTLRRAIGWPESHEVLDLFGLSYWYEGNLWEPPVQLALRDLCRAGDVVFDVGANFGGLTTVMSRMVGPRGVVCAFEASPRIVGKLQRNVVLSGCANTQIFHAAVYHTSADTVPIYCGSHLNDSIYFDESGQGAMYSVSTIALDDFVESTGLAPVVIKMDIEGAEFDALNGMTRLLEAHKPHLMLETQPQDSRCLDHLLAAGYVAMDLNSYRQVRSAADYPAATDIRNNLYIHQDRLAETPYRMPFTFVEAGVLGVNDFSIDADGSMRQKSPLPLERGRYVLDMAFAAQGTDNEMMCGIRQGGKDVFRYHAYSHLLAKDYRDWVLHLDKAGDIEIYFEFKNGSRDPTFAFENAHIKKVQEFDNVVSKPYF